jgi:hypothetical protein
VVVVVVVVVAVVAVVVVVFVCNVVLKVKIRQSAMTAAPQATLLTIPATFKSPYLSQQAERTRGPRFANDETHFGLTANTTLGGRRLMTKTLVLITILVAF